MWFKIVWGNLGSFQWNLTLIKHNFVVGHCPRRKISEISECCFFGTFRHSDNWFVVSKMEKEIVERVFFWNLSMNILFEVHNLFFKSAPNLGRLCLAVIGNFSSFQKCKQMIHHLMTSKKPFFTKSPKNSFFACLQRQPA